MAAVQCELQLQEIHHNLCGLRKWTHPAPAGAWPRSSLGRGETTGHRGSRSRPLLRPIHQGCPGLHPPHAPAAAAQSTFWAPIAACLQYSPIRCACCMATTPHTAAAPTNSHSQMATHHPLAHVRCRLQLRQHAVDARLKLLPGLDVAEGPWIRRLGFAVGCTLACAQFELRHRLPQPVHNVQAAHNTCSRQATLTHHAVAQRQGRPDSSGANPITWYYQGNDMANPHQTRLRTLHTRGGRTPTGRA
jgi:hypothetical protein